MSREQVISQLEDLKMHCKSMIDKEDKEDIWADDVKALDYAIVMIEKVRRKKNEQHNGAS